MILSSDSNADPGDGKHQTDVYIEFQSAVDAKREAVASCQNDWLMNQLARGALVHVAYADDDTGKVALLDQRAGARGSH